jgi:biotin carboxyl carrier protein
LKFRADIGGESFTLELSRNGSQSSFKVHRADHPAAGTASIIEVAPGTFSVLLGTRSFTVQVARRGESLEVWSGHTRRLISLADIRDAAPKSKQTGSAGPAYLRSEMPGKVVRLLAAPGESVRAGQGILVVEAMKMQNEIHSPKDGTVKEIRTQSGATVAAGEILAVID